MAGLGDSVGVEQQRLAGAQLLLAFGDVDRVEDAEQRSGSADLPCLAGVDQHRRGCPASVTVNRRRSEAGVTTTRQAVHRSSWRLAAQRPVQCLQHLRGGLAAHRRGPRVSAPARHAGRAGALAADVADHEHPAAGAVLEHIVEVAAHLIQLPGGAISRLDLGLGHLGKRLRQQRPLQGVGDAGALGVQPRVFHRGAGAAAEPLGDAEVGGGETTHRLRGHQRDRAERPVAPIIGTMITAVAPIALSSSRCSESRA